MHDAGRIVLRKLDRDYDPTDRAKAYSFVQARAAQNEYVTGLIYCNEAGKDMHAMARTVEQPLATLPYEKLSPGSAKLAQIMARYR